jgi:hypothetical protein
MVTFPFFLGLGESSGELAEAWQGECERGLQLGISQRGEEGDWEKNGIQGKGLVGSVGFIPRRWTRCFVVSSVTDWTAGRCFLDGIVSCVHG